MYERENVLAFHVMPIRVLSKIQSAGVLLFRPRDKSVQVLLGHPGGPFWRRKDHGAWTIPKGLIGSSEAPLSAAQREFAEETGYTPPAKPFRLAAQSNQVESSCTSGQFKTTGIQPIFTATLSKWNGLRALDGGNHFLRSTASPGSGLPRRALRS